MSEEELNEAVEYNLEYMEAMQSEEIFGGDYISQVELKYANKNIDRLQQENQRLKNDNAVMKAGLIQVSNKQLNLYKEVIKEVREYIEDWLFDVGGNGASMTYEDINELLQILDKVKEN